MTRPLPSSKLVLLVDRRAAGDLHPDAHVRRYRLARLRFEPAPGGQERRFEYLKLAHD